MADNGYIFHRHFDIRHDVPRLGDTIYVPSIEADLEASCGWARQKKKGGYAQVQYIQKVSNDQHLIFVTEYCGFGMWWEDFLRDQQEELAKKYSILTRAQMLLK